MKISFYAALFYAALTVGGCLSTGCAGKAATVDEHIQELEGYAEVAARWNLEFELTGTIGDGHVMGQAFNISGTHAAFKLSGRPQRVEAATQPGR